MQQVQLLVIPAAATLQDVLIPSSCGKEQKKKAVLLAHQAEKHRPLNNTSYNHHHHQKQPQVEEEVLSSPVLDHHHLIGVGVIGSKSSCSRRRRSVALAAWGLCSVLGFPTLLFHHDQQQTAAAAAATGPVSQGLLAGRIPGLSEPDERGWRTYRRPDEKSGGHGVGWSPIIPYSFIVPQQWEEVPVSIADLGGTEIDLRFANPKEGRLFVIVAPVLRFADLGEDAKIEDIGPPEKVINAFGPEITGENIEGKVMSMEVAEHSGRKYYQYELEPPHLLITATAAGNRLYLFSITGSGLQWKRHYKDLKEIAESFRVL